MEKKQEAKANASNNLDFLWSTNTKVDIKRDCLNQIERISELVNRTNQLNFTKVRSTKEELIALLNDKTIDSGYVTVRDNFGDYGVVGFFALKENKCIHFLFSCRTIGQGVEQYVYSTLGWPKLTVVGDVVNTVENVDAPAWINQDTTLVTNDDEKSHIKIVFKGACDLRIMATFLKADNIVEEFTYVGLKRGNSIEHQNHSVNYLSLPFLSDAAKKEMLDDCVFNDEEMFDTSMYDKNTALIFLSTQIEPNLGIYRNKRTGQKIAWGEFAYPLTEEKNWPGYIEGTIFTAGNKFTREWLTDFKRKYEFIGRLSPVEFCNQLDILLDRIQPEAKVCLLLGSEMPYEANKDLSYENRHVYYKEINTLLRQYAKNHKRLMLIDFNDYLKSQDDFIDNINHYQRNIYYEASHKANEYIEQVTGAKVKEMSKMYLYYEKIAATLGQKMSRDSWLYKLLREGYFLLRKVR